MRKGFFFDPETVGLDRCVCSFVELSNDGNLRAQGPGFASSKEASISAARRLA